MSYILEALKKSEQERQQNNGPTIQNIHRPMLVKRSSRGVLYYLLVFLVFLLIVSFVIVGWYQFLHWQPARPAPVPGYQSAPGKTGADVTASDAESVVTPAPSNPTPSNPTPAETAHVQAAPSPPLVKDFWELPDTIKAAIPPMTFSFHVYSDNPDRRTIIINNRRLREGELISDGLKLIEITPEGVVLSWQKQYFRLAVVENWGEP